jgi:ankyrin repeat protein
MLKSLLEAGANLNARDDLGYNAYDYAVMGKRMENAKYLASLGLKAAVAQ